MDQYSRPETRATTHSAHSDHLSWGEKAERSKTPELRPKESKKSLFSNGLFKSRVMPNKEPKALDMDTTETSVRTFGGTYGIDNSKFGVEVSITGGNARPRKTTFVEKAARFGRETFGARSASADSSNHTGQPRSLGQYTAVKNMSDTWASETRPSHSRGGSSLMSDSWTRKPRETIASSVYDESETVDAVPPLNIVKKTPEPRLMAPPQLPPFGRSGGMQPVEELELRSKYANDSDAELLPRRSTDSCDSGRTIKLANANQANSHFSWTTYAETARSVSPVMAREGGASMEQEPDSRFSWTTSVTDADYQEESPGSSPSTSQKNKDSIMSRRRPVPGRDVTFPKRQDSLSNVQKLRAKELPETPKAAGANDRVEELAMRLERLETHKSSMQRLLEELKKVDMASPLEVTEKMRRENRKKMNEVRARQDEIQSEIFEVGRLLSRARAKAEQAEGQSTGLWLRRVTD